MLNAVSYADFSLQKFFETCEKMSWYKNTLFVLTADHTGAIISDNYKNNVGKYAIPILYYCPQDSLLKNIENKATTQQADIMPSILDYLNYDEKFFAFGNSVFNNEEDKIAISYQAGIYQIIEDDYILLFNGKKTIGLYNKTTDISLKNNLSKKFPSIKKNLENKIKLYIQIYNNSLINNKLSFEIEKF